MSSITDNRGVEISIPEDLEYIADIWPAHNQIMMVIGQTDKIVVTTSATSSNLWVQEVFPELADAISVGSNEVDTESFIAAGVQLAFTSSEESATTMEDAGIAAAMVSYSDFEGLCDIMELTASIFGGESVERAEAYEEYLYGNIELVEEALADVEEQKTLLYVNEYGLSYGTNTIVDEWITAAGAVNAYTEEGSGEISAETIISLDPDVIVVNSEETYEEFMTSDTYAGLTAVQNGDVYLSPTGTFYWSQYGAEVALQVLWAAQLMYPDEMADVDLVAEVQYFYAEFFDYDLSEDDAERIINRLDPGEELSGETTDETADTEESTEEEAEEEAEEAA